DAGPAGGALLNPDDPRPARLGQALGLADHSQQTLGTGRHGLQLFAARGLVEAADDTVLIVIIDTQDDILGHGGLPKVSGFSAGSPNAYPRPSSGEFNRPAGGETAFPHAIFGVDHYPFRSLPQGALRDPGLLSVTPSGWVSGWRAACSTKPVSPSPLASTRANCMTSSCSLQAQAAP